jgi:hypothetical protein
MGYQYQRQCIAKIRQNMEKMGLFRGFSVVPRKKELFIRNSVILEHFLDKFGSKKYYIEFNKLTEQEKNLLYNSLKNNSLNL